MCKHYWLGKTVPGLLSGSSYTRLVVAVQRVGVARVNSHFFDFLPYCLAHLGNTPRRGAKNRKLNRLRLRREAAFGGGAHEGDPQK